MSQNMLKKKNDNHQSLEPAPRVSHSRTPTPLQLHSQFLQVAELERKAGDQLGWPEDQRLRGGEHYASAVLEHVASVQASLQAVDGKPGKSEGREC